MAEELSNAEQQNVITADTKAAHIIPFPLASFTKPASPLCNFFVY
jgi:hypothetical protein